VTNFEEAMRIPKVLGLDPAAAKLLAAAAATAHSILPGWRTRLCIPKHPSILSRRHKSDIITTLPSVVRHMTVKRKVAGSVLEPATYSAAAVGFVYLTRIFRGRRKSGMKSQEVARMKSSTVDPLFTPSTIHLNLISQYWLQMGGKHPFIFGLKRLQLAL
jgi:hypothetical protein